MLSQAKKHFLVGAKHLRLHSRCMSTWSPRFVPPLNGPTFRVKAKNVRILKEPSSFLETLKQKTSESSSKISFASLYLGDGDLEADLVDELYRRAETCPDLRFQFLFDKSRGTRGPTNTVTQLGKLTANEQARLHLLLLPQVERLEPLLPPRWIEGVGVQHMKLYVFDNDVIVSGANLSKDYFTNRQDRYWHFQDSPRLAAFFHDLIDALSASAHTLSPSGDILPPMQALTSHTVNRVLLHPDYHHVLTPDSTAADHEVLVTPLMQLGVLGLRNDEVFTTYMLEALTQEDQGYIATGYFNLPYVYQQQILNGVSKLSVLTAAPSANGFYGARGIAGALPMAYSEIERKFYRRLQSAARDKDVSLYEFERPDWTFHGKGFWLPPRPSAQEDPYVSLVGSPNFGIRSVTRDLECQLLVQTKDAALQHALEEEHKYLWKDANKVTDALWRNPARRLHGKSWSHGTWISMGVKAAAQFLQPYRERPPTQDLGHQDSIPVALMCGIAPVFKQFIMHDGHRVPMIRNLMHTDRNDEGPLQTGADHSF